MSFVDSQGPSTPARGDRASLAEMEPRRGVAPASPYFPRKEPASGASRPPATHVVFDPFAPSRRRSFAEGRVYTPYAI